MIRLLKTNGMIGIISARLLEKLNNWSPRAKMIAQIGLGIKF